MSTAHGIPGIGRQAAQRLARAELSKRMYHPQQPLIVRVVRFVFHWLGKIFRAANGFPGGWWAAVVLAVFIVLLTAALLRWTGPVARTRRRSGELLPGGTGLTARDHRQAAERLAAAGDYAGAVCERVRAIAAELEERSVLAPRTGRTADEFAAEAGHALPSLAPELHGAALLFDEIRYGQRPGTQAGYERVASLDTRARNAAGRTSAPQPPAMAGTSAP